MHHQLDRASGGDGDVGGIVRGSISESSSDLDSDSSLEGVIWMELLSLLPPSLDWGERATIA